MATVNYTIRLNEADKKAAEKVFNELGLTLAAGFNVYLKAVIRQKGIPFDMALNTPTNPDAFTDDKLTPAQRSIGMSFLSAMQNLSSSGFTPEDAQAIDDLQSGQYKLLFKERL